MAQKRTLCCLSNVINSSGSLLGIVVLQDFCNRKHSFENNGSFSKNHITFANVQIHLNEMLSARNIKEQLISIGKHG